VTKEEIIEMITLINEYGDAKFGDEWWPGNANGWIGDEKGNRLSELLEKV
jgi:hypothetical protein